MTRATCGSTRLRAASSASRMRSPQSSSRTSWSNPPSFALPKRPIAAIGLFGDANDGGFDQDVRLELCGDRIREALDAALNRVEPQVARVIHQDVLEAVEGT